MLTNKEVLKIASLSKLKLSDDELARYTKELGAILGFVEKLNSLDLKGVEATSHAVSMTNVFREDVVKQSQVQEEVFAQAPSQEDHLFKVPKVIA